MANKDVLNESENSSNGLFDLLGGITQESINASIGLAKAEEVKPTGIYGAGVRWAKGYFPESRISNLPSVGAQVFYKDPKNGELTHTGLVVKVTENSITTIEGNWSKQVSVRTLPLTDTRIDSFGLPFYEEEPTDEWETVAEWDNYRLQHRK